VKLKSLKLVPILICGAALGLAGLAQIFLSDFRGLQLIQRLEWIAYDWRLRLANDFEPPVSDKLGFVSIGDDALTIFSQGLLNTNLQFGLKWPRHIYGRAVRELKAEGAKAVGLDILFADRRPDHGPVSDLFFRQALEQAGNVTIAITTGVVPDPYFREKVQPLIDGKSVEYVGFLRGAERDRLLGGARALLYPIQYPEAFGLVLVEAMLCGTPVAAMRLGAVPEIVEEGVTGCCAASSEEFPRAILDALSLDRRQIRERTERRFSAEQMARAYASVYQSIVATAGKQAIP